MHAQEIDNNSPAIAGISAHDITIIAGFDKYRSPLELWAERTNKIPRTEQTFQMWLSGRQREVILDSYERLHKTSLTRSRSGFRHPEIDFAIAHPHGWVKDGERLIDARTISERSWRALGWEAEIPTRFLIGCNWTLGVMGMQAGTIAALVGGSDIKECELAFDQPFFEQCCDNALEFLECVTKDIPPSAGANDLRLINLLVGERSGTLEQTDDPEAWELASKAQALAEQRLELTHQAKDIETAEKEIKNQLVQLFGAGSGLLIRNGDAFQSYVVKISEVNVKEVLHKAFSYSKITIKKGN